jgi:hypothetical protein
VIGAKLRLRAAQTPLRVFAAGAGDRTTPLIVGA